MIWSPEEELTKTCQRVRERCESLNPNADLEKDIASLGQKKEEPLEPLPEVAIGVQEDFEDHKDDIVKIEPYVPPPKPCINPKTGLALHSNLETAAEVVTTDEDRDDYSKRSKKNIVVLDASDDSDDEIEVVAVVGGN